MLLLPTESDFTQRGLNDDPVSRGFPGCKARRWDVMERRWSNDETICPVAHGYLACLECLGESKQYNTFDGKKCRGSLNYPFGGGGKSLYGNFWGIPLLTLDFLHPKNAMALDLIGKTPRGVFPPWRISMRCEFSCRFFRILPEDAPDTMGG